MVEVCCSSNNGKITNVLSVNYLHFKQFGVVGIYGFKGLSYW